MVVEVGREGERTLGESRLAQGEVVLSQTSAFALSSGLRYVGSGRGSRSVFSLPTPTMVALEAPSGTPAEHSRLFDELRMLFFAQPGKADGAGGYLFARNSAV